MNTCLSGAIYTYFSFGVDLYIITIILLLLGKVKAIICRAESILV